MPSILFNNPYYLGSQWMPTTASKLIISTLTSEANSNHVPNVLIAAHQASHLMNTHMEKKY